MSVVEELDSLLLSLQATKPPGITKGKIESITSLCLENIESESVLIQKIFTHFKKTFPTHKLGVLYVVDSVTRQWVAKAGQVGQQRTGSNAPEGTYAAGIHKITELLPVLMNELLQVAPENQKDKIKKLLDIWERSKTFPARMLAEFKQKLDATSQPMESRTPPGSPAPGPNTFPGGVPVSQPKSNPVPQPAPASSDAGAILAALANMGKRPAPATPAVPTPAVSAVPAVPAISAMPAALPVQVQNPIPATNVNTYVQPQQPVAPPVNQASALPAYTAPVSNYLPVLNSVGGYSVPQTTQVAPAANEAALIQVLQVLVQQNLPPEQIAQVLGHLGLVPPTAGLPAAQPAIAPGQNALANSLQNTQPREHMNHNIQNGYDFQGQRDRSRSPDFNRHRVSPPNRRDSPTYGVYDPSASVTGGANGRSFDADRRGRGRGRGTRGEYRQRSPPPDPASPFNSRNMQPKWVDFDPQLQDGCIKVLSRTLFIGGASASEAELKSIFTRFGKVQSCIVNHDKRHAFVKMINRQEALAARQGMENMHDPEILGKARQTKWGVGFGPRDCFDYSVGMSVIPMDRLTDADRKWVLNAEYGGTGGRPMETGMVIEEPDIEIGAGVSSKAISRRMGPEPSSRRGGHHGSSRGGFEQSSARYRKLDRPEPRHESPRVEANTIGVPPPVPGFGFQLPGMPMIPR